MRQQKEAINRYTPIQGLIGLFEEVKTEHYVRHAEDDSNRVIGLSRTFGRCKDI